MGIYNYDSAVRAELVKAMRQLVSLGLTRDTAGNISVLTDEGMLITPTGIPPEKLLPEQLVLMQLDGKLSKQQLTPSSEWQMHAEIYQHKPDIHAVVHCHSMYATILACAHKNIPAFHYMVAGAGGVEIPLAGYATFGTAQLAQENLTALQNTNACLLANHGQLTISDDLAGAIKLAALVEELAQGYWGTLAIGGPVMLQDEEMTAVTTAFSHYGQQSTDS